MTALEEEGDWELLDPVSLILYAESMIRAEHRVTDADWLFWGNLAGYLNEAAAIQARTIIRSRDHREFNRAVSMARGCIRMLLAAREGQ